MSPDPPRTRVVVADDQPVVLGGLAAMLRTAPDLEVVGTATDGDDLVRLVDEVEPDVALVDIRMPRLDGLAATRLVTARRPATRVLVLTTFDLDEYVYAALRAGASGFLLKDAPAAHLTDAVRAVTTGSLVLGPWARRLVAELAAHEGRRHPGLEALTAREHEVLLAVARGLTNAEIGAELFITEQTVKSHVSEVLRKLGCRDRVQLVIAAHESGLMRGSRTRPA